MGTIPCTRDEMVVALHDTVAEAFQNEARSRDVTWTWDRSRIHYDAYGNLHVYECERILAQMIEEIQVCVEHGWPWDHALVEPWLCYISDTEFVGAQGGLQYMRDTGRWE